MGVGFKRIAGREVNFHVFLGSSGMVHISDLRRGVVYAISKCDYPTKVRNLCSSREVLVRDACERTSG